MITQNRRGFFKGIIGGLSGAAVVAAAEPKMATMVGKLGVSQIKRNTAVKPTVVTSTGHTYELQTAIYRAPDLRDAQIREGFSQNLSRHPESKVGDSILYPTVGNVHFRCISAPPTETL